MMIGAQVSAVYYEQSQVKVSLLHKHLQSPASSTAATICHEEKKAKISSRGEKNSFSL